MEVSNISRSYRRDCVDVSPRWNNTSCVSSLGDQVTVSRLSTLGLVECMDSKYIMVKDDVDKHTPSLELHQTYATCNGDISCTSDITSCEIFLQNSKRICRDLIINGVLLGTTISDKMAPRSSATRPSKYRTALQAKDAIRSLRDDIDQCTRRVRRMSSPDLLRDSAVQHHGSSGTLWF